MSTTRYEVISRRFWKRKDGFTGMPATVSIYGALPSPPDAYEIAERGFTIRDNRNNTTSNYWFGKIGIETAEEGAEIIRKLVEGERFRRAVGEIIAAAGPAGVAVPDFDTMNLAAAEAMAAQLKPMALAMAA